MFHVVLHRPEIPPNTGNIIRLCANTGARLHLVAPLGFALEDRQLKRAGLDYHEYAALAVHDDLDACLRAIRADVATPPRVFALTTKAAQRHDAPRFSPGDIFVFGSETNGLPEDVLERFHPSQQLRLPMRAQSRSLNLSNAVAVMVYEAWRQCAFEGASAR